MRESLLFSLTLFHPLSEKHSITVSSSLKGTVVRHNLVKPICTCFGYNNRFCELANVVFDATSLGVGNVEVRLFWKRRLFQHFRLVISFIFFFLIYHRYSVRFCTDDILCITCMLILTLSEYVQNVRAHPFLYWRTIRRERGVAKERGKDTALACMYVYFQSQCTPFILNFSLFELYFQAWWKYKN